MRRKRKKPSDRKPSWQVRIMSKADAGPRPAWLERAARSQDPLEIQREIKGAGFVPLVKHDHPDCQVLALSRASDGAWLIVVADHTHAALHEIGANYGAYKQAMRQLAEQFGLDLSQDPTMMETIGVDGGPGPEWMAEVVQAPDQCNQFAGCFARGFQLRGVGVGPWWSVAGFNRPGDGHRLLLMRVNCHTWLQEFADQASYDACLRALGVTLTEGG